MFIFFVGCPTTYSEVSEKFEVRVRIKSDLPFIPWDFSKSRILNIRKVRVGSDMQCFELFGQSNSVFVVIETLITCNLGIALEKANHGFIQSIFFVNTVSMFFLQFIYNYCFLNMRMSYRNSLSKNVYFLCKISAFILV